MFNKIIAHTSFIGHTGYNNHSREFFTSLNNSIPVRIRNFTHTKDLSYLSTKQKNMIIHQTWNQEPYEVGQPLNIKNNDKILNIVLNETNHYYFYENYNGPKIAYNVWESTLQPDYFFNKLLEYDQLWVPTQWQKDCSIEQGFPENKVKIVPEAVDVNIFKPGTPFNDLEEYHDSRFKFLLFGRWDYRKSTTEIIKTFLETFSSNEPVDLICSIDNPFSKDGLKTIERLKRYNLNDPRIKIKHFPSFNDYVSYLRNGHVFVSCSRAEGWGLPLSEAIASGVPTISSKHGSQLDYANRISHFIETKKTIPAKLFQHDDKTPGEMIEPDFEHLSEVMRDVYKNYSEYKKFALKKSKEFGKIWTWENTAKIAYDHIEEFYKENKTKIKSIRSSYIRSECDKNTVTCTKEINGIKIEIKGDHNIEYDINFLYIPKNENIFFKRIKNNQFVKVFDSELKKYNEIIIFITSKNGECLDFSYNPKNEKLNQINKNKDYDFIKKVSPPTIITATPGGGSSYLTKFLRMCGMFGGYDNIDINERKTHESKIFSSITGTIKNTAITNAWYDDNIYKCIRSIDHNKEKWVNVFKKILAYRLKMFFGDYDYTKPWGFKSPLLGLVLPIWHDIFPNAKIINMKKDWEKYKETSKTKAGEHFYNKSSDYFYNTYTNPDIKEWICEKDYKFVIEAYKDYTSNISNDRMSISLRTAIYLLWILKNNKPRKILERGSGFSTFIFCYYKKYYSPEATILSTDTEQDWLEKTKEFLKRYSLKHYSDYYDINDVPNTKYDFVFEDSQKIKRKIEIDKVLSYIEGDKGIIFFDDYNSHPYIKEKSKEYGMYFYSLKKYTYDLYKRYGCLITRKNINTQPTKNIMYFDFEDFVSKHNYCNKVLNFCNLKKLENKKKFIDKLKETKFEGKLPDIKENPKDIIIINSYTNTQKKKKSLKNCLKQLKKTDKEILLTTHYPVSLEIQELLDYYIYDKNNPMIDSNITFNYYDDNFTYKNRSLGYSKKAYANILAMKNGIEFSYYNLKKEFFYYIEYDSFLSDEDIETFINLKERIYEENKSGFIHKKTPKNDIESQLGFSYSNIFFCFDIDFFINKMTFPKNKENYFKMTNNLIGTEWFLYDNLNSEEENYIIEESDNNIPLIFKNSKFGMYHDDIKKNHCIDIVREKNSDDIYIIIINKDFKNSYDIIEKTNNGDEIKIKLDNTKKWWYKNVTKSKKIKVYYDNKIVFKKDLDHKLKNDKYTIFEKKISNKFKTNFKNCAFVEITGDNKEETYNVKFIDKKNWEIVHEDNIKSNMWTKTNREYYTDWLIEIRKDDKIMFSHNFDLKNKNTLISINSKSLGDTIAWIPYIEEFRKKHNCNVFISTFWNKLFEKTYKKLNFIPLGKKINNIYAQYSIGCFDKDKNKNPIEWQGLPLQKVASDILGLEYKEIKPEIVSNKKSPIKEKYVCMCTHSTFQAKYWNHENGWQKIIDYLNHIGYKVVLVSKEEVNFKNIINKTAVPIEETISLIKGCEFFVSISTGPMWIAYAFDKPVIIINGPYIVKEVENSYPISIEDGCKGCMSNPEVEFDRGDWNFCPFHKGTERQFECTKRITPNMVKEKINNITGIY